MASTGEIAAALGAAVPYINKFRGMTVVIKVGGAVLERAARSVARDIALLQLVGVKPVVVHGGSGQIDEWAGRLGVEQRHLNGLRYTDSDTMEIVEMVLGGRMNKRFVSSIQAEGGRAVGITGVDGNLLNARKWSSGDADLGLTGEVQSVNPHLVEVLRDNYVPVVAPFARGDDGELYNINADYAAAALAGGINAGKLLLLSDVPGILDKKGEVISSLTARELGNLITRNVVSGGMVPKAECALRALREGVGQVHIIPGETEYAVLLEMMTDEGIGTLIAG